MTNTPMSERETELLGTAKAVRNTLRLLYGERPTNLGNLMKDLNQVIAAYDPKLEPVPVIPAWPELTEGQRSEIRQSTEGSPVVTYNAIRRITSKAPTE